MKLAVWSIFLHYHFYFKLPCFNWDMINFADTRQCDEKKPVCENCSHRGMYCSFSTTGSPETGSECSDVQVPNRYQFRPYHPLSKETRRKIQNESSQAQNDGCLISTRSVGTQCNLSPPFTSQNQSLTLMSLADLQLFHHFIIETACTLVDDQKEYPIWQNDIVQWSFEFSSILHLILAISALHMSHQRPELRNEYVRQGEDHFTFGIQSVTAVLAQLSAESCQRVYIAAVLICFVYFGGGPRPGEYLIFSDDGPAEWLVLMRGTKLILHLYHDKVFTGILRPKHKIKNDVSGSTISPSLRDDLNDHTVRIENTRQLLERLPDSADQDMYTQVINGLLSTLNETHSRMLAETPAVGLLDVLIGWVYRLPERFVNLLEQKEPVSLVILAHWAMLLKYMRSVWFMEGWDEHVLYGIRASLPVDIWQWVE